jgi:hypothetical protein
VVVHQVALRIQCGKVAVYVFTEFRMGGCQVPEKPINIVLQELVDHQLFFRKQLVSGGIDVLIYLKLVFFQQGNDTVFKAAVSTWRAAFSCSRMSS